MREGKGREQMSLMPCEEKKLLKEGKSSYEMGRGE